ncbi:hypothetical protein Tco_1580135, partial [Tanacetum coccineum]
DEDVITTPLDALVLLVYGVTAVVVVITLAVESFSLAVAATIGTNKLTGGTGGLAVVKTSFTSDDELDVPDEEHKFGNNEFENPKDDSGVEKESPHSYDPFNIYDMLQKKKGNLPLSKYSDPTYPPGFTPVSENINKGEGSILEVMDDLVKVGQTMRRCEFESLKLLQRQLFRSLEDWEVSSLQ